MGPLRRHAVPLVLLLAVACGRSTAGTTLSAAGGSAGAEPAPAVTSSTPPTTAAPAVLATTTVRPPAPSAAPTTAAPRLRPPAPPAPATTLPPTVSVAVAPETVVAVPTHVSEGTTSMDVRAVREQYLGEKVYVWVEATSGERITAVRIDFGDGYVTTDAQSMPSTLLTAGTMSTSTARAHVYPAAGRYRIAVTITAVPGHAAPALPPGAPTEVSWIPSGPEHGVTVTADLRQRPDAAPPGYPRLPPMTSE